MFRSRRSGPETTGSSAKSAAPVWGLLLLQATGFRGIAAGSPCLPAPGRPARPATPGGGAVRAAGFPRSRPPSRSWDLRQPVPQKSRKTGRCAARCPQIPQHRRIARVVVLPQPQQFGLVGVGFELFKHMKAVQASLVLGWNFVPQALGCFNKGFVGHRAQSGTDTLNQP